MDDSKLLFSNSIAPHIHRVLEMQQRLSTAIEYKGGSFLSHQLCHSLPCCTDNQRNQLAANESLQCENPTHTFTEAKRSPLGSALNANADSVMAASSPLLGLSIPTVVIMLVLLVIVYMMMGGR
jgi:hypothetical protein